MKLRPYSHPGKFEGGLAIDSVTYDYSLDGCDAQEGSVTEDGEWYGLLRGSIVPSAEQVKDEELTADELAYLTNIAGAIIREGSQGFVDVEYYDTVEALEAEWAKIELAFASESDEVL